MPSHCSASNVSIVRPEALGFNKQAAEGPKFANGEDFKKDKINKAFANLFGGGESTPNFMSTPSFNDNKHQIKARPIFHNGDPASPNDVMKRVSSVFSPIPDKPQS
jgi:hypothetical protein